MTKKTINWTAFLYNIFVIIDDLIKFLPRKIGRAVGRKASMEASEVITLIVYGLFKGFKTVWHLYADISHFFRREFPSIPSYKSFNALVLRYSLEAIKILQIIMNMNTQNSSTMVKFIDSTSVAVCKNKRIFHHKVCEDVAMRGKSSMGWFYGFKLHICVDERGNLLSCVLTPGNVGDREPVQSLLKAIQGIVVADAGYISAELTHELHALGIQFLTGVRGNMKKLMTTTQHKLLKARQIVETGFGLMKSQQNLVSSYARSVAGHFARILYSLLAYSLRFAFHPQLNAIS